MSLRADLKRAGHCAWALVLVLLGGCSFEPHYEAPALPVATQWPIPESTPVDAGRAAADIGWRDFFVDPNLQALIELALQNSRDLRIAMLNVQRARAEYRVQRADLLPTLEGDADFTRQQLPPALNAGAATSTTNTFGVGASTPSFELDLWGRVRSLSHSALERYLSEEESRRNVQLVLIAEVARAYLELAADQEAQSLAQGTLRVQSDLYELTQKMHQFGGASGLDLAQARTTVDAARIDVARYAGQIAQDRDALTLLVGGTVDAALLPQGLSDTITGSAALPAGLPSTVLLKRPDILGAEHQLRAANADIGAARAAMFPTISLTGSAGFASGQLSDLIKAGSSTWTLAPQAVLPLFEAGRLSAGLDLAHTDRDLALAQYEKAVQQGFREVADALQLSSTLFQQVDAATSLVNSSSEAYDLSERRFKAGRDSYLLVLDSQRSLYAARQGLIAARLARLNNRVDLYKTLGGGWIERDSAG